MTSPAARGRLRIYLGAAPGVGKTYAMLAEGHRRAARGTDVVVGVAETQGRAQVEALLDGLATVAVRRVGDTAVLDVPALRARRPAVALVDRLAAPVPPADDGVAHRWQQVDQLLDAGIDVVSTLDVAEIESLADVVAQVTGVVPEHSVPDPWVRTADQIELVDMTPEALRRRLAHGNIYPADRVDAALSQHFRVGTLTALRELALLWLADRVEESLDSYRREHGIEEVWAARERVLVGLTGGAESEHLLRRAARIASRGAGGALHAAHVTSLRGPSSAPETLARLRALTEELGGTHHTLVSDDPADALLQLARGLHATQVVVGASSRGRWRSILGSGVGEQVIARAGDIDVHVVTHARARHPRWRSVRQPLDPRRVAVAWVLAVVGPVLATAALLRSDDPETLALEAMTLLAVTVGAALVGGRWPGVVAALVSGVTLNWFFTAPEHTLAVNDPFDTAALVLFLLVGLAVASVVDAAARRAQQADRARREADTLMTLNRSLLQAEVDVGSILDLLATTFGLRSATLLRRTAGGWEEVCTVGDDAVHQPHEGDEVTEVSGDLVLALRGRTLKPDELRVLSAFATLLAVAHERHELSERAAEAQLLAEGNRVRTALLAALSHDLRTPLAGIKAAVSSLRSPDVTWTAAEQEELLGTVEESADRLRDILANLLDLTRLDSDAVHPLLTEVGLDDVVAHVVAALPSDAPVELHFAPGLPPALADAGLLDRVVANLVGNALDHTPPGTAVTLRSSQVGDRVQLHVVDRGPGVPEREREQIFQPFRRLHDSGQGLGLGLAVARGLTEACGGQLLAEDTPGGGLTMVVDLPAAARDDAPHPHRTEVAP